MTLYNLAHVFLALVASAAAQTACPVSLTASVPAPSVAPGFEVRLIASGLKDPRGLKFDYHGHLLVVEQNVGVTALELNDYGGSCMSEKTRHSVVNDTSLNHGITVSFDGKTLYASSSEAVYSYPYDEASGRTTGENTTIINGMTGSDHTTRTLLLSKKEDGTLIVTRGSTSNLDAGANDLHSGVSQVKAYNLTNIPSTPYDYTADGKLLGWGLRNEVGIDEEPCNGGLYSVENSADEVARNGNDIHEDNPGEEMNFLGYMIPPNGTEQSPNQGTNFGYPKCFAAWSPSTIPDFAGEVGNQFTIGVTSDMNNDVQCKDEFTQPRLTFQAHMAPLDIKFDRTGSEAWITFHGSWDRSDPSGYKVGAVRFSPDGPLEPSNSTTALIDIVTNEDNSKCPDECFRPVAMAFDNQGRLYFSSDSTGEIYLITQAGNYPGTTPDPSASADVGSVELPSTSSSTAAPTASQQSGAPRSSVERISAVMALVFVVFAHLWI